MALSPLLKIERVGGISGLREILTDFYGRIFQDPMIGYLFIGQEIERLIDRELEWTTQLFDLETSLYRGRPLREAHKKHPIRRGHFHRRNQILKQTLQDRQVDVEVTEVWLTHSASLIHAILGGASQDGRCEQTSDDSPLSSSQSGVILISGDKR